MFFYIKCSVYSSSLPSKGNRPVNIKYRITPALHKSCWNGSTITFLDLVLIDGMLGDVYSSFYCISISLSPMASRSTCSVSKLLYIYSFFTGYVVQFWVFTFVLSCYLLCTCLFYYYYYYYYNYYKSYCYVFYCCWCWTCSFSPNYTLQVYFVACAYWASCNFFRSTNCLSMWHEMLLMNLSLLLSLLLLCRNCWMLPANRLCLALSFAYIRENNIFDVSLCVLLAVIKIWVSKSSSALLLLFFSHYNDILSLLKSLQLLLVFSNWWDALHLFSWAFLCNTSLWNGRKWNFVFCLEPVGLDGSVELGDSCPLRGKPLLPLLFLFLNGLTSEDRKGRPCDFD